MPNPEYWWGSAAGGLGYNTGPGLYNINGVYYTPLQIYNNVNSGVMVIGPDGKIGSSGTTSSGMLQPSTSTTTTNSTVNVTTTTPPPPPPPVTQYTLAQLANQGWNTHARSIDPIQAGEYFDFTADDGVLGACLSFGPRGVDGRAIHRYTHSLIVDLAGIKVYEGGRFKQTLRSSNKLTNLRIYRHRDGRIAYVSTLGTETMVHTSEIPSTYPRNVPVYVYGYLFSSGDKLTSAAFRAGEVQYGSV